jgi:hypothetical protein
MGHNLDVLAGSAGVAPALLLITSTIAAVTSRPHADGRQLSIGFQLFGAADRFRFYSGST